MQNIPSVMDIVNSNKVTTEDALRVINELTAEQLLETNSGGHNILHCLASDPEATSSNLDIERVAQAIVVKNPEVLNARLEVLFTNPKTNEVESLEGDTPFEMAIRQDNLALVKILAPHYKDLKNMKIFDYRLGEQRAMTPEEIEKLKSLEEEAYTTNAKIKTVDNIRENVSPLAFAMRYGQFKMFEYLYENGFESQKGIDDLSKYKLENPSKENLEELYRDLFITGESEVLKGLHRYLEYYEGHEGKNSEELITALNNKDKAKALELISQGHYVYDCSALDIYTKNSWVQFTFFETLNHPNFNVATTDKNGNTLLHLAAYEGKTEIVKAILKVVKDKPELLQSVLLSQNNNFGRLPHSESPLILAVRSGSAETIKAILEVVKDKPVLLKSLILSQDFIALNSLQLVTKFRSTETVKAILEVVKDKPELFKSEIRRLNDLLKAFSSIGGSSSLSSSTAITSMVVPAAAMSITEFYDNQTKEDASKKRNRDEAPESNKRGRQGGSDTSRGNGRS